MATLTANERAPLSPTEIMRRAASLRPLSWRVTDSGGTWLELLVTHRTSSGSLQTSPVLVEEHESGWTCPVAGALTADDVQELLADVARWACGSVGGVKFFEMEII